MARPQKSPSKETVFATMNACEPYTTEDLNAEFPDTSRWTIYRRLQDLRKEGLVKKKKHAANHVSWWRIPGQSPGND